MASLSWVYIFFYVFAFSRVSLVSAQTGPTSWTASPFSPPALPIAVRSPYLNVWFAQGNSPRPVNIDWTRLWPIADAVAGESQIIGWLATVRVDGKNYVVWGGDQGIPNSEHSSQTAVEFTPTRTTILSTAGPVEVNVTIWSPIEPTDVIRQSFPGIYFGIGIRSTDGASHDVSIYSDITGEILTGDADLVSNWTSTDTGPFNYHVQQLNQTIPFSEIADHAQDAQVYYGMQQRPGLTYMIGRAGDLRELFEETGGLTNQINDTFRPVRNSFPVTAHAISLGQITQTKQLASPSDSLADSDSMVVWSLAHLRDPVVRYTRPDGSVELRSPAYLSKYATRSAAYEAFISDASRAIFASTQIDGKLLSEASKISPEYANLISLTTRQVMGGGEITMTKSPDGKSWNETDVMMFVKDMGRLGGGTANTATGNARSGGSVNPVNVLYAAFPAYLYLNPAMGAWLLRPLLLAQSSPSYPLLYAAPDLGEAYPNATGNSAAHNMGVEHSANMLLMTLAHAQTSGDGTLVQEFYPLLKRWGDYLATNAMALGNGLQTTADSISGSSLPQFNQTNLALKGVLAVAAMAKISASAGQSDDAKTFDATSKQLVSQWTPLALASDNSHLLANFEQSSSSAIIYNLFADKWLQLEAVPDVVYDVQTRSVASSGANFGVQLTSFDGNLSRTDWSMFTAATLKSINTRNLMVTQVQNYASSNRNNTPFAAAYDPTTGSARKGLNTGLNSVAQGAMYSLLALTQEMKPITLSSTGGSGTPTGAIVGGVIGGVIVLGALSFVAYFLYRRRQRAFGGYVDVIRPSKRDHDDIVNRAMMPGVYAVPFTLDPPDQNSSVLVTPSAGRSVMTLRTPSENVSSPLLEKGVSSYDARVVTAGRTPAAAVNAIAGHPGINDHGSAYFRQPGSPSDLGPSVSQVEHTAESQNQMDSGSSSERSTVNKSGGGDVANEDLRREVDDLRREMERLREVRYSGGAVAVGGLGAPNDEAPPSYS